MEIGASMPASHVNRKDRAMEHTSGGGDDTGSPSSKEGVRQQLLVEACVQLHAYNQDEQRR